MDRLDVPMLDSSPYLYFVYQKQSSERWLFPSFPHLISPPKSLSSPPWSSAPFITYPSPRLSIRLSGALFPGHEPPDSTVVFPPQPSLSRTAVVDRLGPKVLLNNTSLCLQWATNVVSAAGMESEYLIHDVCCQQQVSVS